MKRKKLIEQYPHRLEPFLLNTRWALKEKQITIADFGEFIFRKEEKTREAKRRKMSRFLNGQNVTPLYIVEPIAKALRVQPQMLAFASPEDFRKHARKQWLK
tara:strand:- start:265 stop:570 length:306 start_codon:yes stop_codon:yes gene_type:complete